MNKMKKLLSVVLAVVLAFSALTVLGSAAKTSYQTVANLQTLGAYSPYGQVTRLSTEERTSIVLDALDNLLPSANINMGEVFNVLGLSVTIDLTSVDRLCYSLDTIKSTFENGLAQIAMGIVNLGILESLETGKWTSGMTRAKTAQYTILSTILNFLSDNTTLVGKVFTDGLDLGIVSLGDMSAVTDVIGDLPGLIKGLVFGLIERWDDDLTTVKNYDTWSTGNGNVENAVNFRVKKLFTDNMSNTTVKYDANGTMTSEHTAMPIRTAAPATGVITDGSAPRHYYHVTGTTPGSVMTIYHLVDAKEAKDLAKTPDKVNGSPAAYTYFKEAQTYVLEEEVEGNGVYVWKAFQLDADGGYVLDDNGEKIFVTTLKWYNDNSPLLPGFDAEAIKLSDNNVSAGDLLYTFIPTVFKNLAPVVLNGSVKKLLAEFVGVEFTFAGVAGSDEVLALGNDAIFAEEQGDYVFEWSDYYVDGDTHYYRYLDDVYVGDTSNTNNYFDIINWNYEIGDDFVNEFVPANDTNANDRLLLNLNDLLIKVAETITVNSVMTTDSFTDFENQWTRPTFAEGNANLVANLKAAAQAIISLAPQHIFGSDYATNDRCYYDLLVAEDNATVLTGIAAMIVDLVMPSMTLPGKSDILNSGATAMTILAAAIREFAAQLIPEYKFDALIYADFGTTTADPDKSFLTGKDNNYWLDVIMTMGINIGFEYIRAFADMGEGTAEWDAFVAYSGYAPEGKTYEAMTTQQLNAHWEGMLDYFVDWALSNDYEWTWKMENLVDADSLTIDLTTAQDPWVKLDHILDNLLPVDEILNVEGEEDLGMTELEKLLRHDLVLGLIELRWAELINVLQFNGANNYFRTGNILDQLALLVKNLVNGIFAEVGNADGNFVLIPSVITDFDSLANQSNLSTMVKNLVGALYTALVTNGLADTALPFLNMFLGWKTDPQVIAPVQVWTSFRDGNDYAFQWVDNGKYPTMDADNTLIKVLNNSAGMLETHRNSSVTDHAYDIEIKEITSDATVNTLSFTYGDGIISPYETLDIKVGGTYRGEEAVTVTIEYEYVGKDGQPVGGTQYTSISFLVSNQYEDSNIEGRKSGDESDGKYGIDPFKAYQFTEDIYTTVTTFQPAVWGTNPTIGGGTSNFHWVAAPASDSAALDCNKKLTGNDNPVNMNATASQYFEYYQNQAGGWGNSFPKDGSTSGKLYKAKSGVTAETEFPYGLYDMGQVAISYSDDVKFWKIDYIYYNDYDIYAVYTENMGNAYHANQGVDAGIYNEYNSAWKDIVKYATYPMMTEGNGNANTDYVKTIQPKIPAALERFEAAKEAYVEALAEAQAVGSSAALPRYVQDVEAELALDGGDEPEINFQNYEYYEYFNYADLRTEARNLVATYYAPEIMDTYYIEGSGIREAELNAVITAEANDAKAAGITASRRTNDQAAIDASIVAHDEWKMPVNDPLVVEDMAARLAYYRSFVNDSVKEDPDHKYFLDLEIAHIDAQQLNAADYEAVTWGRFQSAYDYATAVSAGTAENSDLNSIIFQAKWDLMVRYKELLKKADSLIEAGGTAILEATIDEAEAIFALGYDEIELSEAGLALAADPAEAKNIALGHLIQGLGYYYEGEDGNQWNLYANSAYEYADNDRPNKQGNQAKVDACNANLEACIAYFATAVAEPNTLVLNENAPFEAYIDLDNNIGGEYTGTIYGFDTLGWNDEFMVDGTIADFVTTAYGDDYLEVIPTDGGETTGTIINVLDEDGNAVESYVYIYYGDVDMDGLVGASDAMVCEYYEMMYEGFDNLASFMAGDLDGDAMPGSSDALIMEFWEMNYESMPFQADVAANVYGSIIYEIF